MTLPLNHVPTNLLAFESLWLLSRRFMLRNCLYPHEFLSLFRPADRTSVFGVADNVYSKVDLARFARYIGHTSASVASVLPETWEFAQPKQQLGPIKLCPECAELGFHSVFHEIQWLDHCPIHDCQLTRHCLECGRLLRYTSTRRFGPAPNELPCGHRWTDANLRYAADLPTDSLARIATWLHRLHRRNTDERWYAVALGRGRSLNGADEDFQELLDLFAAIASFPTPLRDSLRLSRYVATQPVCNSFADLRTDWFESALQRAGRYAQILNRTDYDVSYMGDHRTEAVTSFRRLGKDGFLKGVRNCVGYLDLRERRFVRRRTDRRLTELLGNAFLHKHLLANTVNGADPNDTNAYFRIAMRMTGEPLGLLQECGSGVRIYWAPLAADWRCYLELLKRDDWVIHRRQIMRELADSNESP